MIFESSSAKQIFTQKFESPGFQIEHGPVIGKTMGLSALAGLASEGVSQIMKKITGGQIFQVPNKHLHRLAMMDNLLTKGQIRDLAKAYTDNSDMMFKVTNKQVGNGIGSILASIGIPMIIDALRGKGVGRGGPRIGKISGGAGPRIGYPPPFIGSWPSNTIGRGKKKKNQGQKKQIIIRRSVWSRLGGISRGVGVS